VLIGTAARTAADIMVVSRRDRHLQRGTLGGVSQRVLAYAPCAAAMVPSPA
jgi:nucleotide-binding universal stress UspA family protein